MPRWSAKGDKLFYIEDGDLMEVEVITEPSLDFGVPKMLFGLDTLDVAVAKGARPYGARPYDVSGNGERFLVAQRVDAARPQQSIVVVQNWLAEFEHLD